jgi:hypothetical protein
MNKAARHEAYKILGRLAKVDRILEAMDRYTGHRVTASEAAAFTLADCQAIFVMADAVGDKSPSAETMDLVTNALISRESKKDPFENF